MHIIYIMNNSSDSSSDSEINPFSDDSSSSDDGIQAPIFRIKFKEIKLLERWLKKKRKGVSKKRKKSKCIKIGFAAETENHQKFGLEKLKSKDLDMIVINDVSNNHIGFESDYNQVKIITKKGDIFTTEVDNKKIIASEIMNKVKTILN